MSLARRQLFCRGRSPAFILPHDSWRFMRSDFSRPISCVGVELFSLNGGPPQKTSVVLHRKFPRSLSCGFAYAGVRELSDRNAARAVIAATSDALNCLDNASNSAALLS